MKSADLASISNLKRKRGLFVGLCTIDLIYQVSGPPRPNSKNVASSQMVFAGGPATNAAITFSILGGTSRLLSALGHHPLSAVVSGELGHYQVHFSDLASDFDGIPAVSSILVTENSGERIVISANAAALAGHAKSLPSVSVAGSSFILFDGHHLDVCAPLLLQAKQEAIPVILDGGSWKPALAELLSSFDAVIASSNFMPPGCHDHASVLRFLRKAGAVHAAITRGEKPVLFLTGDTVQELPVPQVTPVDSLGAGDIFHGAFCAAFEPSSPNFVDALAFASTVASLSVSVIGPRAWRELLQGA